jgi:hypothetical protein
LGFSNKKIWLEAFEMWALITGLKILQNLAKILVNKSSKYIQA